VTLIYSNKNETDTIFYTHLKALEEASKERFRIKFLFSNSNDIYSKRISKWLLDQLLESYFGKNADKNLYYVCGPFEYMQTVEITLKVHVPSENIVRENFSALPRLVLPTPPDTGEHLVTIVSGDKVYEVRVRFPHSILSAARKQQIELPYSCEAGRCGSCAATCTSGKIWMAYNEVLVDKELEKGRILTCQGFPVFGDARIVVDAEV
jgi:ring-1,2-phenylacetyl-CoA epoxidase subunit PaaE